MRKVPTRLRNLGPEVPVVITTTHRFAQDRILYNSAVTEMEGSEDEGSSARRGVPADERNTIGEIRHEVIAAPMTDPRCSSDDEEEETEPEEASSEASDTTERN